VWGATYIDELKAMQQPVFAVNETLARRLSSLVGDAEGASVAPEQPRFAVVSAPGAHLDPDAPLNVVVTANEITDLHGTGPLVKRICRDWVNTFAIRARNDWGVQDFGDWNVCLMSRRKTRDEFYSNALSVLRGRNVRTVLCIPFLLDEIYTSIAIHDCFGAKLCAYIMDDQNIAAPNIPDALMREFLERCRLRLATHPELQRAYEQKYNLPFHVLPAIVPAGLVRPSEDPPRLSSARGAMIGSFWDQTWFDRTCSVLAGCKRPIDWFGNNRSPWFDLSPKRLANAGITPHGVVPESELAEKLAHYPFVIVPAGALDGSESNTGVARLSLPGRILFAVATSQTPVLILGSPETCGARFVRHFGLGDVAPYHAQAVSAAMDRLCEPEAQNRMRRAASQIGPSLSDNGISRWLAESIELGQPADRRFQDLFDAYDANIDLAAVVASRARAAGQ
jgi:hypothetical protein